MTTQLREAIARLRRGYYKDFGLELTDTMLVCDALEDKLWEKDEAKTAFDKRAYMREYMRKRRARKP